MPLLKRPKSDLTAIAEKLLESPIFKFETARSGGNNRVFKVDTGSASYALKFYPPQEEDQRDRLGTEFSALTFLWSNGVSCIPEPIIASSEDNCAVYQWLNGEPVTKGTSEDILEFARLLTAIHQLTCQKEAGQLPDASASCFSIGQIFDQIDQRKDRLIQVADRHPQLDSFLTEEFGSSFNREANKVRSALNSGPIDELKILKKVQRTLSPSDFGFHNTIRAPDGQLKFIDFEYFGWDDPVKMVADVILHPGASLDTEFQKYFFQLMKRYFSNIDSEYIIRFEICFPLYALIWCLIQLGEFLPERWARREFAGQESIIQIAQNAQLAKARHLLQKIDNSHLSGGLKSAIGLEV